MSLRSILGNQDYWQTCTKDRPEEKELLGLTLGKMYNNCVVYC
jgi:hypothetical protein